MEMKASSKTGGYVRQYITSKVVPWEVKFQPYNSDLIAMKLRFTRCVISYKNRLDQIIEKPKILVQKFIIIPHLSRFKQNPGASRQLVMEEVLSSMGVPEDEHSRVSSTIFNAVLAATNLMPIQVDITYYNVRMRREDDELMALRDQPVTNNGSSCSWELPNEGWEQVHRDSLEAKGESLSCVICMEEYGTVGDDQSVTRLPCLHLFHGHCILDWLMDRANNSESQTCPLCRYSIPYLYLISYMTYTHDPSPDHQGGGVLGCDVGRLRLS